MTTVTSFIPAISVQDLPASGTVPASMIDTRPYGQLVIVIGQLLGRQLCREDKSIENGNLGGFWLWNAFSGNLKIDSDFTMYHLRMRWKGQSRHLDRQKVCSMGQFIFTSRYMCRFFFFSFRLLILKDRNFLFSSRENDDVYSERQTKIYNKYTASLGAINWYSQCKFWVDEREIERDEIHNGQNIILKLDAIYNPIESDNEC